MTSRTGLPRWWGAACGLLAAAAAMGIGQLFAGFTVPAASPVVAVGGAAIDRTPLAVKDWATSTFGTADKTVLLGGVLVVVFLYSMAVGVLAMRRLALGFAGLAIFAGIGLAAALTRHDATGSYAVPTIFGALAGAVALRWLVLTARRAAAGRPGGRAARQPAGLDPLPPIAFDPGDARRRGRAPRMPPDGRPARRDDDKRVGWVTRPAGRTSRAARAGGPGGQASAEPGRRFPGGRHGTVPRGTASGAAGRQAARPGRRPGGDFLVAAGVSVAAAAIGERRRPVAGDAQERVAGPAVAAVPQGRRARGAAAAAG